MAETGLTILKSRSYARRAGIIAGDRLLSINGEPVIDFIDYNWFEAQNELVLEILDEQGIHQVTLHKPVNMPIGLDLGNAIYPEEKVCQNKCIFCFVDQLPCGMRKGVYLKDDDWRYSVLFGNFVTLTNVTEPEMDRIIRRKASPINVSVHACDPEVRTHLLGNRKAGKILDQLEKLTQNGIKVNAQAVLVPGVNTGAVLQDTLETLYALGENVMTFAAVPVGMTKMRQGLTPITSFDETLARETIQLVETFAQKSFKERGTAFCYASDELYYIARLPYPVYENTDYLPQLGNGVGMYDDFMRDIQDACGQLSELEDKKIHLLSVTGEAAYGIINEIAVRAKAQNDRVEIDVLKAENTLFGNSVTVAGLLSGKDILAAASGKDAQGLLIPADALRGDVFLDDMTVDQLETALGMPVRPCLNDCYDYIQGILDLSERIK